MPTSSISTSWTGISYLPSRLGTVVVASLRPHTDRTLHGHLMVDAPESFFEELAEAGLDVVSFHHEAVGDPAPAIDKARAAGLGVGVTINMETPVEAVFPYLDRRRRRDAHEHPARVERARPLNPAVYPRIEAVRTEIDRRGLDVDVEIDGGVKIDNAQRAVDAGATVLIARERHLPGAPTRPRARAQLEGDRRRGGGLMAETILVVDDDPDIARFVEVNLRSAGYDVAVAGDGEEALEQAGALRPDLVLLDVMMPRIDGFEVAQRLRKNPQTANTCIIMLTAKALSADKVTGPAVGRRRLHHQAVRPDRAARAGEGHAATRQGDAEPLAAHRAARQHPHPGGDRAPGPRGRGRSRSLYCDLDNFKAYNDQKGFVRGDRLIQSTARIIQDAVVAHDGGAGVRRPRRRRRLRRGRRPRCRRAGRQAHLRRFDAATVEFYEPEDLERGFVRMEDRKGVLQDIPLVGISIGIASSARRGRSPTTARRWPSRPR